MKGWLQKVTRHFKTVLAAIRLESDPVAARKLKFMDAAGSPFLRGTPGETMFPWPRRARLTKVGRRCRACGALQIQYVFLTPPEHVRI